MEWIGWMFVVLGLLFTALCVPLALGKVPPNWFYGFRTPKTLSSPDIWYPANRALGREGAIAGVASALASLVVVLAFAGHPLVVVVADLAILLLTQAVVVTRGFLALRRL